LEALARQATARDTFEVIVVVDGSNDGTRATAERFQAPYSLRVIWQPNRGRAAACNAGIAAARGELIALLDDDMEPAPEFVAAHLRAHAGEGRLGVLGAVPIAVKQSSPPVVAYVGAKFNRHLEKLAHAGRTLALRDFYSGNFSIHSAVLREVGGFDEAFKIYGNEDLELSLRLARAGVRLVYSAEALAHQHYTKGFAALARDTIAKGRTAVLLASKHPNTVQDLKLSTYGQGSLKWRALRAGLLGLSRLWAGTPNAVARFMEWLEQGRPARMNDYYVLALDYYYWLGARAALREKHKAGQGLHALPSSARGS
jgi:GT2 family glycosyltransferase